MICYPSYEISRYQKLPHALQTLRKIVRSTPLYFKYTRHKTHKTLLISLIRNPYCPTVFSQLNLGQENIERFQYVILPANPLKIEQNWEEQNEWNHIFFRGILCLFVNLVPSASFCYNRKDSKMGGGYKGDFRNPNFATL